MESHQDSLKILFVCLGNICRSPLAEGVFQHRVEERGLEGRFEADSAGTGAWHVGEPPDDRSAQVARRNGIELSGSARQMTPSDLHDFDWVIAMDRSNLDAIRALHARHGGDAELALLRDFDAEPGDVPDPYYGGPGGFDRVFELVSRSIDGLLSALLEGDGGSRGHRAR